MTATPGTRWERKRYALWAPVYDLVVRPLRNARRRSMEGLSLAAGERVLVVGAGTGEDLPYVPGGVLTVATDLTPAMLRRSRPKARERHHLAVMDGHRLASPDAAFDAVVLHLILAVIPDPARCLAEAARVLRPGGRITVLDKFVAEGRRIPLARRVLNLITRPIATDITRSLEDIVRASGVSLERVSDQPVFGGRFTIVRFLREG